ncbi:tRNA-dependent cyclodipeptide synthase [Paludibacterium sp.]|uniref:tRNA-dependent cyclodipeptide synthase n=1 Tax=Paludibacterium sp. TaxID=1917523 RepID=UPI0025CE9678|nr:tRNA-dependent cyclodipeptide synthase [Paludibacterium sp.]MBV8649627.1 tRNA-dependent cyclodipeptide synthase [Paludibacterium sp.]
MTGYAVRVRGGAGWRKFDSIRLMISVGREYHEGAKLAAAVEWINRNENIKTVHVSVADTLQRHNLIAYGMNEEKAFRVSQAEGALWVGRNHETLSGIKADCKIRRWNEWLENPCFTDIHSKLVWFAAEESGLGLLKTIEADAQGFLQRKTAGGASAPCSLLAHSQRYIFEELAVFAMQCAEMPAAEVYPSPQLQASAYLQGKALPEGLGGLTTRYMARLDFVRKKDGVLRNPQTAAQVA